MKRLSAPWIATGVLAGLLALAAGLLLLGQRENRAIPDSTSYGPSGTRAFADLLRFQGYRVRSERRDAFRLDRHALAIALFVPSNELFPQEHADRFSASLKSHIEAGGRALVSFVPPSFTEASKHAHSGSTNVTPAPYAASRRLVPESGYRLSVGPAEHTSTEVGQLIPVAATRFLVRAEDANFASFASLGEGVFITVRDGLPFTNRFLDREDNAAFAMRCVSMLVEPGAEIVFLEAAHTPSAGPTLAETLGPWAVAGWNQAIVLFVTIVLTLGIRFGEPTRERTPQRGARELADAIASLYARSRATRTALEAILLDADRRLRAHLKIPRDAPPERRNERLPNALVEVLAAIEAAAKTRTPARIAADLARRLQVLLDEYFGERHRPSKRRKI